MKRVVVAILLCICLLTSTAYAVIQLAPIAAAAIGASLLTVLGTTNTKVALNPQGSFGYDGPDLTVPVAVYNQYMQAGAQIALGYLTRIPYNMVEAYRLGLLQAEPEIMNIINTQFHHVPAVSDIAPNTVLDGTFWNKTCPTIKVINTVITQVPDNAGMNPLGTMFVCGSTQIRFFTSTGLLTNPPAAQNLVDAGFLGNLEI